MIPVGVTLPCERAYVKLLRSDLAKACGQLDDLVPVALDDPSSCMLTCPLVGATTPCQGMRAEPMTVALGCARPRTNTPLDGMSLVSPPSPVTILS